MNDLVIVVRELSGSKWRAHFWGRRGPADIVDDFYAALGLLIFRQQYRFSEAFRHLVIEMRYLDGAIDRYEADGFQQVQKPREFR